MPPYLGPEFFVAALCDTHVFKLRDALLQFAGGSQCRGNLHWDKEVASQDIGVQEAEGRLRMELLCGHPSIRFARTPRPWQKGCLQSQCVRSPDGTFSMVPI